LTGHQSSAAGIAEALGPQMRVVATRVPLKIKNGVQYQKIATRLARTAKEEYADDM